nr:protein bicaudal C 1 [Hymenolepis microstoma]
MKTDPYDTLSTICQISSIPGQEDRVTMKLDVAHTEHSHLIGRSGHCVKAMMLDTSCHIHFPDSNRAPNVVEKSNQVSISGRPNDVERARKRIRQMLPLVYIFTIQNTSSQALTLYRASYIVHHLEMKFSVEVTYRHYFAFPLADLIFRNHPSAKFLASGNTIVVSVRGLAFFSQQVTEATNILLEHHFGKVAEHKNVWMTIDIEPKHQLAMLNQASPRNLTDIIHDSTGARIWFPSGSSTNPVLDMLQQQQSFNNLLPISPRRNGFYAPRLCPNPSLINPPFLSLFQRPEARTMITMYGSVNACFMARKTLMNLLPVSLIAEMSNEEAFILSRMDFFTFKSAYDVTISFRSKARNSFRQSIVLKTNEANVDALYTVYSQLKCLMHSGACGEYPTPDHRMTLNNLEGVHHSHDSASIAQTLLPTSSFKEREMNSEYEKLITNRELKRSLNQLHGRPGISAWSESNSSPSPKSPFLSPFQPTFPSNLPLDNAEMFPQKCDGFMLPRDDIKLKSSEETDFLGGIFEKFSLSPKDSEGTSLHCQRGFDETLNRCDSMLNLKRKDQRYSRI